MPKIVLKDIKCAECGADVAQSRMQLNGLLEIVCLACYLRNMPTDDVDAMRVEIATATVAGLRRQLRPKKLTKREYAEAQRFTDICMGREPKEAARG